MPITKELIQQLREMEERAHPLNEPQQETLKKMLELLQGCSRADLLIRINGREEVLEADFFQRHMPLYVALRNNIIPLLDEIERLTHLHELDHSLVDQKQEEIERLQGENEELQAKIGTFRWEAVKKWAYKTYGLKDKEEDAPTALSNSQEKV